MENAANKLKSVWATILFVCANLFRALLLLLLSLVAALLLAGALGRSRVGGGGIGCAALTTRELALLASLLVVEHVVAVRARLLDLGTLGRQRLALALELYPLEERELLLLGLAVAVERKVLALLGGLLVLREVVLAQLTLALTLEVAHRRRDRDHVAELALRVLVVKVQDLGLGLGGQRVVVFTVRIVLRLVLFLLFGLLAKLDVQTGQLLLLLFTSL